MNLTCIIFKSDSSCNCVHFDRFFFILNFNHEQTTLARTIQFSQRFSPHFAIKIWFISLPLRNDFFLHSKYQLCLFLFATINMCYHSAKCAKRLGFDYDCVLPSVFNNIIYMYCRKHTSEPKIFGNRSASKQIS